MSKSYGSRNVRLKLQASRHRIAKREEDSSRIQRRQPKVSPIQSGVPVIQNGNERGIAFLRSLAQIREEATGFLEDNRSQIATVDGFRVWPILGQVHDEVVHSAPKFLSQ
jgi:hypothetical protein